MWFNVTYAHAETSQKDSLILSAACPLWSSEGCGSQHKPRYVFFFFLFKYSSIYGFLWGPCDSSEIFYKMDLTIFFFTSGKGFFQAEQLWPSEHDRYRRWLRILAIFQQISPHLCDCLKA